MISTTSHTRQAADDLYPAHPYVAFTRELLFSRSAECRAGGLRPDDKARFALSSVKLPSYLRRPEVDRLRGLAEGPLEEVHQCLKSTPHIVMLCDPSLYLVHFLAPCEMVNTMFDLGIKMGTSFKLESIGTHAVNMAAGKNLPVYLPASGHYLECLQSLHSMAAPISPQGAAGVWGYIGLMIPGTLSPGAFTAMVGLLGRLLSVLGQAQEKEAVMRGNAWLHFFSAAGFTAREMEIVVLACRGLTISRMAKALSIEEGTVKFHLRNIYRKTGTSRLSELVAKCWQNVSAVKPPPVAADGV